jgi:Zn-dependent peptidase ImmA (M78 family)
MENDREIIFDVSKKAGLSLVELKELLEKWQEKLEMKDWKMEVKIVEFRRKNGYRQSGDFVADVQKKEAQILMTNDPWRGDEEYTLVHEMLHVLFYDYDKYSEDLILSKFEKFGDEHDKYLDKLEGVVHQMTRIILGRSDR